MLSISSLFSGFILGIFSPCRTAESIYHETNGFFFIICDFMHCETPRQSKSRINDHSKSNGLKTLAKSAH